jgi:tetraacyldisaccharide 4'-kinase
LTSRLSAAWQARWWRAQVGWPMRLLQPLSWLYRALAVIDARVQAARRPPDLGRPVVVVGNLIVGGAGKTPTVIALVEALRLDGWCPGVVSRGYGRTRAGALVDVQPETSAATAGDEPLLIRRRTGAPVVVGADRLAAARRLLATHPEVDVLVSDDGLQHHRLPRNVEVVVFDDRGIGNGLLLPAGPLREPLPRRLPARMLVVYNAAHPSTALPGHLARRALGGAWPLRDWCQGRAEGRVPLDQLRGRPLLAAAGMGEPERFFRMLEAAGLQIKRLPLPDHARFDPLPWPVDTPDVLVTEKDAVKLSPTAAGRTRVWVVALDFELPCAFMAALRQRLTAVSPRVTPNSP